MKKGITASICLYLTFTVFSGICQVNPFLKRDRVPAFKDGEVLSYYASYSNKIMSMNVADVELSVHNDTINNGKPCLTIIGAGATRPFFNIFFKLNDVYRSSVDPHSYKPIRATSNQKEGGYLYETDFRFDWEKRRVKTMGHNIKRDRYYRYDMQLGQFSYDALTLFYNLRTVDFSQAQNPGDKFEASLVLEDTIRTLYLKYLGKEQMKATKRVGTFNTKKFSCEFAVSTEESFKDGSEFFIWISDDKNKIPIYLESPIKIGKIYVILSGFRNLANEPTSLIQ